MLKVATLNLKMSEKRKSAHRDHSSSAYSCALDASFRTLLSLLSNPRAKLSYQAASRLGGADVSVWLQLNNSPLHLLLSAKWAQTSKERLLTPLHISSKSVF